MTQMVFRLHALLTCHYVRLVTGIETEVVLDHFPTEQEAIQLLAPIAEETVARAFCEGCLYELGVSEIQLVGPAEE